MLHAKVQSYVGVKVKPIGYCSVSFKGTKPKVAKDGGYRCVIRRRAKS